MSEKINNNIKIGNNNTIKKSNIGNYAKTDRRCKKKSVVRNIIIGIFVAVVGGVIVSIITKILIN